MVLVILGLLVGGILAGRSLIRASELRSVSADLTKYRTVIYAFRDKYMAWPGDMPNAQSFWPDCTDGTNNACNGNGDGHIWRSGMSCSNGNYSMESVRSWQHLSLAGLAEGDYSLFNGVTCNSTYNVGRPGTTVPILKISDTGILFYTSSSSATLNRKFFVTGKYYSDSLENAFLTPEEAWNIDVKMDDGLARRGKVWGNNGHPTLGQSNCYSGNDYVFTEAAQHCRILYFIE